MSFNLKLGFYVKKASVQVNNVDGLSNDGVALLDMVKNGNDENFQQCCDLLRKNLSVMFINSNTECLEEIFKGDDDEIEADEIKVVKVFKVEGDEICFSAEGSFTIEVLREIVNDDQLRKIEKELGGRFDNGVCVQVQVFKEPLDDLLSKPNEGDGDVISSWHGLGVHVINN